MTYEMKEAYKALCKACGGKPTLAGAGMFKYIRDAIRLYIHDCRVHGWEPSFAGLRAWHYTLPLRALWARK